MANTLVTVATRQNTPASLELAAAAWQAYALGKRVWYIQISSVLASGIVGPIVATTKPSLKVWVSLAAVIITLVDLLVFEPLIKRYKERGAKIQDEFDCDVFDIERDPLATGNGPAHEDIVRLARRRRRVDPADTRIRDWYPIASGEVPDQLGRLVCQRASTRWDGSLRRELVVIVGTALAVLLLIAVIIALVADLTVEGALLSLVMPMLPLFTRAWKECSLHWGFAEHSERLRGHIDALWLRAVNGALSTQRLNVEARAIQTELYRRRAAAPFVPTWYFQWRHKDHNAEMERTAEKLIEECRDARAEQ